MTLKATAAPSLPKDLDKAIGEFIVFIQRLPPDRLAPAPGPEWGPREVLEHLVYWHETYVRIVEALLAGREPELARGTFKALNAQAVRDLATERVESLTRRLALAQARLRSVSGPASARGVRLSFREGSKQWPFDEALLRLIAQHVRNHQQRLRQATRPAGCR